MAKTTYRSRVRYPVYVIRTYYAVSFSYIVPGMYYRICWRNNKKRQQENGVFRLAPSQGSDSGETPLFVGFSNLGNIVGQLQSPYEGYTHFLWRYVADKIMNEPQSGTITFGTNSNPSNNPDPAPTLINFVPKKYQGFFSLERNWSTTVKVVF